MRVFISIVFTASVVSACASKKEAPPAVVAPPAASVAKLADARPVPPAKPLPALAVDPGGASGTVDWIAPLGGTKTDVARAVAMAAGDATLIAGDFEDVATFGAAGPRTSIGKSDGFVARMDAAGAVEWVAVLGGPNQERCSELAIGHDGAIAIGGLFSDTLTAGTMSAKANGSDDLFVAGLDPKGEIQWLWTAGGTGSDDTTALAAAAGGGWLVAVAFSQEVQFGTTTLTSRGGDDAALIKLGPGGDLEWVKQIGGEYPDAIDHLAVDGNGNVFVLGRFTRSIDLGGGPLTTIGASDLFLARFDPSGGHVWSKSIGNALEEVAGGLAVDPSGALAITGSFDGELSFLGAPLVSRGESDVFVARVSGDGELQWAKAFGGDRADLGQAVAVDDAGNVVAAGWFETTIDVGTGPLKSKGYRDGWVAKVAVAGQPAWSRRFGDWDHDGAVALAMAADGTSRLAGLFRYQLDLKPAGPVAVQSEGQKFAKPDAFVARLAR